MTCMGMLPAIDQNNFDSELGSAIEPVLLDVSTRWCAPCRALLPVLEQFAKETKTRVISLDAEAHPDLAARLRVTAFPTLILFRAGAEVARQVGLTTLKRLNHMLES